MVEKVRTPKRKYTMVDIAKKLGISPTAVSMAIRNTNGVSVELRNKILKAAEEMDYTPALAAQMLRSRNTGHLGLYIPINAEDLEGRSMPAIAYFVSQCELNNYSYHIELEGDNHNFKPPSQLAARIVDGALFYGKQNPQLLNWLANNPQYKWVNIIEKSEYCVLSDNKYGIYQAVEHLAALGHRKIAFAYCDLQYDVHSTALAGYRKAVSDFNLCCDDYLEAGIDTKKGFLCFDEIDRWVDHILQDVRRPTAIICNDHKMVNSLIVRAAYKGIRVPEHLSLISYGVKSLAEHTYPLVTTIESDYNTIMEKGIGMLIRLIENQHVYEKQIKVIPKLVKRDSVGPVSK